MTWIKLDDNAVDHPKLSVLSDKAFRWWVRGLSYSSRFLTDGMLPKVFWKQAPNGVRTELVSARLWDWIDPDFSIHDYAHHQSIKAEVEADKQRNREKAAAFRERRRKGDRLAPGDVTDTSNRLMTDPENREQRTDTENRDQTTTKERAGGLVLNPLQFSRLQESHAYVGAKLRVPNALHSELMAKSGADADQQLRGWYARLDEELELSGKATGDVFVWLRPRHQAFAIEQGWIDAAPKAQAAKPVYRGIEAILADEAAAKAARKAAR